MSVSKSSSFALHGGSKLSLQDPLASETECEDHSACLPFCVPAGNMEPKEQAAGCAPKFLIPAPKLFIPVHCFLSADLLAVTRLLPNSWPKGYY